MDRGTFLVQALEDLGSPLRVLGRRPDLLEAAAVAPRRFAMPPGAAMSNVSSGPMNDQRRPSPSRTVRSMSSADAYPFAQSETASLNMAP